MSFDDVKLQDNDWIEYKSLKINKNIKSINPHDLPKNFSTKACKLVDEFHRKTFNENVEWMLYFDYITGEVVYCWKGDEYETGGQFDRLHFKNRHIASLHNHPKKVYSFPSLDNFDILENDFEDYEIICANSIFWIIESKGILENELKEQIISDLYDLFLDVSREVYVNFEENEIGKAIDDIYSKYLLNYLNREDININIKKKEYS